MTFQNPSNTLKRLFCGLTENTFQVQFGIADTQLVDYLSDLLLRFVRQDALESIRSITGKPLRSITAMAAEADLRVGEARRQVHRHIGDYALFWTGFFPEALRQQPGIVSSDRFSDFCIQGKRSYYIASTIEPVDPEDAPGELLERLSEEFELCAYGLREVRRELERSDEEWPGTFLIN
jgi:hypothetical protein